MFLQCLRFLFRQQLLQFLQHLSLLENQRLQRFQHFLLHQQSLQFLQHLLLLEFQRLQRFQHFLHYRGCRGCHTRRGLHFLHFLEYQHCQRILARLFAKTRYR